MKSLPLLPYTPLSPDERRWLKRNRFACAASLLGLNLHRELADMRAARFIPACDTTIRVITSPRRRGPSEFGVRSWKLEVESSHF
jgi:hypothetical protein